MSKILIWFKTIQIYFVLAVIVVAFFFGDSYGVNRTENTCKTERIEALDKTIEKLEFEKQENEKLKKTIRDLKTIRSSNHSRSRDELIDRLPTKGKANPK